MPDKTIERTLEVGKWRLRVDGGHDVTAVRLKGMRNRAHPLYKVEPEEFLSRCIKTPDGKISESTVTRGVPVCYKEEAGMVCLWPSPAHQWIIEIDLHKRGVV